MNTHMPMTNNDCDIPVLLVATQAPLDVLHSNAATRFLAVTQMMESLANLDITSASASGADAQQIAHAAAMLLRDGCDVMDVLGRQIRAQG
ncbi:short-chain dehydrogenase [Pseudomonas sp. RT6P73]